MTHTHASIVGFLNSSEHLPLDPSFDPLATDGTDQTPFTFFFNKLNSTDCSMMACSKRAFSRSSRSTSDALTIGLRLLRTTNSRRAPAFTVSRIRLRSDEWIPQRERSFTYTAGF